MKANFGKVFASHMRARRFGLFAAVALLEAATVGIASSADNFWINPRSDYWDVNSNWSNGAPNSSQRLINNFLPATIELRFNSYDIQSILSVGGIKITGGMLRILNTLEASSIRKLQLKGILGGAGTLNVADRIDWEGGLMDGPGTTNAYGGLVVGDSFNKHITGGRIINNLGEGAWAGAGDILGDGTGVFNNRNGGIWRVKNDQTYSAGLFNNEGLFIKNGGNGETTFNTEFDNDGAVLVRTGILRLLGGGQSTGSFTVMNGAKIDFGNGTYEMGEGTSYNGPTLVSGGVVKLQSGVTFTGETDVTGGELVYQQGAGFGVGRLWVHNGGTLRLESGELVQTGNLDNFNEEARSLTGGTFILEGNSKFKFGNAGLLINDANIVIAGPTAGMTTLAGVDSLFSLVENRGSLTIGDVFGEGDGGNGNVGGNIGNSGTMSVGNSGTLNVGGNIGNSGTLTVYGDDSFDDGGEVNAGSVGNSGTLSVGNSGTMRSGGGVGNSGTMNIAQGGTVIAGGYLQTGGLLTLNGTLTSPTVDIEGGEMGGSGTINGDLGNSGTMNPGNSAGTLTVNGDFAQEIAGELNIQLGGIATSEYDRIIVSGDGVLSGTLNVELIDGFEPMFGDTFVIMTFGGIRMGEFTNVNFPGPMANWRVIYGSDRVSLQAVPEPATLIAVGAGLLAFVRRRRKK